MKRLQQRVLSAVSPLVQLLSRRWYWELRARDIDGRWGRDASDHALIGRIVAQIQPRALLDIGCGTGRLFPVFRAQGVPQVVGQDVSRWALRTARARCDFPGLSLTDSPIERMTFPDGFFDLCISNRVLSAVPPDRIAGTLRSLARMIRHLYLNEYSDSDRGEASSYWFKHDYLELLSRVASVTVLERGTPETGNYLLLALDQRA